MVRGVPARVLERIIEFEFFFIHEQNLLGPVHMYPDIFESATLSFLIQKLPRLHVSGVRFNLPVQTYPYSLYYPAGLLWEYWQQSWRRGCHFEYSIHGKELVSIWLCNRIKNCPDLASTRFRIHIVFKNFHSGEPIQKVVDSYSGFTSYAWTIAVSGKKKLPIQKYPDTCGRSQTKPLHLLLDYIRLIKP